MDGEGEEEIFRGPVVVVGLLEVCLGWLVWRRRLLVNVGRSHRDCRGNRIAISSSNIRMVMMFRISEDVRDLSRDQDRTMDRLVLAGYYNRYIPPFPFYHN